MVKIKVAVTIAGSDSGGGAGVQADIKTMMAHGVFAASVIVAVTAQNTVGVFDIEEVSARLIKSQLKAVFEDIFPDSVKIGMMFSSDIVKIVAEALNFYSAKNIVVDPVMVSTSGFKLISDSAVDCLKEQLFPIARLITPNIFEAEALSKIKISSKKDMVESAKVIGKQYGCSVLCKGGHSFSDADDLLFYGGEIFWFKAKKIASKNTHGTGCSLSSAIAANFAKGQNLVEAVRNAKFYVFRAISSGLNLGCGRGPINHMVDFK